jgi:hypothetical protein
MKDRHVVLALMGVLSAYLVVHAGMAGFALYLFADAARQPPASVDGPYSWRARSACSSESSCT